MYACHAYVPGSSHRADFGVGSKAGGRFSAHRMRTALFSVPVFWEPGRLMIAAAAVGEHWSARLL